MAKIGAGATARCPWCGADPLYTAYHDSEWGVPCHDERTLFEFLILEIEVSGVLEQISSSLARSASDQRVEVVRKGGG